MRRLKCNEYSPTMQCLPDTRHPLPHFPKDAPPRTSRPRAAGIRTGTSPPVPCLTAARQHLPHFSNRCHSSHRPAVAITPSTRPLHGHQSASARGSRHRTSWAAGIRTGTSPPVLCLPDAPQLMPHCALSHADGCVCASGPSTCRTCSSAPPCRGCLPGKASIAARGWWRRACPRTPSWSRRRAARRRTACRVAGPNRNEGDAAG